MLLAEIRIEPQTDEKRRSPRRTMQLEALVRSAEGQRAIIWDLSETGLQFETAAPLEIGDEFEVDLPESGVVGARVVRRSHNTFGCEFLAPIPTATVSAALLRSPVEQRQAAFDDLAYPEDAPQRPDRDLEGLAMISLIVLLAAIIAFTAALMAMPISSTQF